MKKFYLLLMVLCMIIACVSCSGEPVVGERGATGPQGSKGDTPKIEINEDGYWVIDGVVTDSRAEGANNPQGLDFFLKNDGTYVVEVGYAKYLSNIVIPDTYNGKPVTEIAGFNTAKRLERITIPDTVTRINDDTFNGCINLKSVTIPDGVTYIGSSAFQNCVSLTEITIPENVNQIGAYAFRRAGLTTATFALNYGWYAGNDKVSATEINDNAADLLTLANYTETWLRDVDADVEALDPTYATGGYCNPTVKWALTYIDETKTSMKLTVSGSDAMPNFETAGAPWYAYAEKIVEIEVGEGITEIGRCAFYGLTSVRTVTLNNGLTAISEYAFRNCNLLKNLVIPSTVTYISETAFEKTGVSEIVSAEFMSVGYCTDTIKWIVTWTDAKNTKAKLTLVGTGEMPDYDTAGAPWFAYLDKIVEIEVGEGITSIGRCAFYGLQYVSSVTLHEGLLSIGDYAFSDCYRLRGIKIPATATDIKPTAFNNTVIGKESE